MMSAFSDGLLIPAMVLALFGWVVPKLVSMALPEGVWPLMLNGVLSTVLLFCISMGFFVCLYLWQGMPWDVLMEPGLAYNVVFFGRLGLSAVLIWVPIMLLSLAGLPTDRFQ